MRALGILLVVGTLALLGLFVWPMLRGNPAKGPPPATFSAERVQAVRAEAAAAPAPAPAPYSGPATTEAPGTASAGVAAPATPPPPHAPGAGGAPSGGPGTAATGKQTGPLCDRLLTPPAAPVLALPPGRPLRGAAGRHARGSSRWTWVNLWAAWCKPCKEEMPLLSRWVAERRGAGDAAPDVLFVSVDDDGRELRRFLEGEGRSIEGDFLWVDDDSARSRLYAAMGVSNPPVLPLQAILDPSGRLRCVRSGSVTRRDLDDATRTFGWR